MRYSRRKIKYKKRIEPSKNLFTIVGLLFELGFATLGIFMVITFFELENLHPVQAVGQAQPDPSSNTSPVVKIKVISDPIGPGNSPVTPYHVGIVGRRADGSTVSLEGDASEGHGAVGDIAGGVPRSIGIELSSSKRTILAREKFTERHDTGPEIPLVEGSTSNKTWQCMRDQTRQIAAAHFTYRVESRNSNSVARTLMENCGVTPSKPVNWAPGFDKNLLKCDTYISGSQVGVNWKELKRNLDDWLKTLAKSLSD